MFYLYTYDISLLILVILMAEKEMMIASKSRFKKRKKKWPYSEEKKNQLVIYKDVQGRQQKFILNVETVHVKRLQACFQQLEYRKENKISTDTFTLRTPTAILTFFRLGFYTLPHISQL